MVIPVFDAPPPPPPAPVDPVARAVENIKAGSSGRVLVLPTEEEHDYGTKPLVYFVPDDPEQIVEPVTLTGDEADMRNAIRALADGGLLSPVDMVKYRDIIEPKMSHNLRKRFQAWRKRNAR